MQIHAHGVTPGQADFIWTRLHLFTCSMNPVTLLMCECAWAAGHDLASFFFYEKPCIKLR